MDENVKKALNNPKVTEALKGLTPEQTKKLKEVLSDRGAAEKLLKTPEAQQLLKKFIGENGNG